MGERRTEVLRAAIELLDEVGIDGLTMRLLASRLGVRASALYRHYPSKQALLDAMVVHLSTPRGEARTPADAPWDEQLRRTAGSLRQLMLAHRDGARLMSTFHTPGPEAAAGFHDLVGALVAAGTTPDAAVTAVDTVLAYVNGHTLEEQARKTDASAWPGHRRDLAFDNGLELILTGIRATLP
ncbi:TetR/AcrR family transcriptional regulator C-terminal domain-containing protein [Streptacidiphilus griseoplanus]|uniref:TetR/AcrR family transcriptional regulator C-terminal domain-containing protein n=1 Tax=Peterkaempfera griseoplana TaxID=66896 RepID=UPI0006E13402|nr:TetR/AcrR family transcriptional regulator C-terminal domain-containing protein [Peterkaempfera griseoplana]